ncbi:sulfurtransferase complex subunit TusC [Marinifaba aquimaris]|uniref:sulfurtransferase complex subunit TusC n=1 Tax=Marinifaba aquimaris TaxID=2741323 RepID=UPI001C2DEDDB|nr:sulfurtransferase complex subunit TusC [Marinifaba aquimaris]
MITAIINQSSPYQTQLGREALDLALVLGTYEQDVRLFFKDAGVLQLMKEQNGEAIGSKDFTSTFKALDLYEIEQVYVLDQSLNDYGLTANDLTIDTVIVDAPEFYAQLRQCQCQMRF